MQCHLPVGRDRHAVKRGDLLKQQIEYSTYARVVADKQNLSFLAGVGFGRIQLGTILRIRKNGAPRRRILDANLYSALKGSKWEILGSAKEDSIRHYMEDVWRRLLESGLMLAYSEADLDRDRQGQGREPLF